MISNQNTCFGLAVPENPSKALETQLAHRPELQDLVERNIIKGIVLKESGFHLIFDHHCNTFILMIDPKVAPALQQHRDELEKRKIEDSLRHKIDHRPTPEALVEQNILKGDSYMFQLFFFV